MQLQAVEPLFNNILYICLSKFLFLPAKISREKLQTNIMENLKQASGEI